MIDDLPPEIAGLTPYDLLALYDGPDALACPPSLARWVKLARRIENVRRLRRQNDLLEAELIRRRAERYGTQ
jgi:hypothetical protein